MLTSSLILKWRTSTWRRFNRWSCTQIQSFAKVCSEDLTLGRAKEAGALLAYVNSCIQSTIAVACGAARMGTGGCCFGAVPDACSVVSTADDSVWALGACWCCRSASIGCIGKANTEHLCSASITSRTHEVLYVEMVYRWVKDLAQHTACVKCCSNTDVAVSSCHM